MTTRRKIPGKQSSGKSKDAHRTASRSFSTSPKTSSTSTNKFASQTRPKQQQLQSSRRHAEDAFSSSSDEEDYEKKPFLVPKSSHQRTDSSPYPASEFDKALMTGVPSIGAASFDGSDFPPSTTLNNETTPTNTHQVDSEEQKRLHRRQVRMRTESISMKSSSQQPQPPTPPFQKNSPVKAHMSEVSSTNNSLRSASATSHTAQNKNQQTQDDLAEGVLPDVLMTMRQRIESLTLFDSDMMKLAEADQYDDRTLQETRESLKRSSQQSLSAAVLVSLAHKRYERRRLAAMEIEKVIRSLVQQNELERVRAILLLLSDDYVRSTSEDARKGGVVALAACGIGLKKAKEESHPKVMECRDLILASVVHACQDHSQRVRYYATESLFNVVKVIPTLAVQHFFILFEILRSLYADVEVDVRSGAELLDKKLKEVIVGAINSGSFSADSCVPIFARFVYMRNKATKRLTLTWLQELNEKLIGTPVLEFLHLFLSGIFAMIADPNISIRQSALAFLQSVLPKLLMDNETFDDDGASMKADFDKLIQSLVTTLEHPDPFVRKVAMYWMCRIVKAYMGKSKSQDRAKKLSAASMSVRNSLPHVLPGILLSIGDTFHNKASTKDSFLPDQTTHSLAEQTNLCLQEAVRRDGRAYATHLDGFLVALREELDSPGHAQPIAIERKQYRMDVTADGTGIESTGWFRASSDTVGEKQTTKSRLCALEWITVLYESVVPDVLKAEFAREFISPIIHQLVDNPPELIIFKSLEVLAKITVPVDGERKPTRRKNDVSPSSLIQDQSDNDDNFESSAEKPMTNADIFYALEILGRNRGQSKSRDREVFSAVIQLHASNHHLLADLSRVIQFMCTLQPPEFVFVSFAVELDRFVRKSLLHNGGAMSVDDTDERPRQARNGQALSADLHFVSSFVQQMNHVMLSTEEAKHLRDLLKDCIGKRRGMERDKRRTKLFHILLHSFSHNLIASVSLCLWVGAFSSASSFLQRIDPLDIDLGFLLELDQMVELLERPLFRHFHLRMLEADENVEAEGSGAMLIKTLKLLLMIVPQSTCYRILRDRIVTISRFRQSALVCTVEKGDATLSKEEHLIFAARVLKVRKLHCDVRWQAIRSESLETEESPTMHVEGDDRRQWLGYANEEEERISKARIKEEGRSTGEFKDDPKHTNYQHLDEIPVESKNYISNETNNVKEAEDNNYIVNEISDEKEASSNNNHIPNETSDEKDLENAEWKAYWTQNLQQN